MNDAKKYFIAGLAIALGAAVIIGTIIVGFPRPTADAPSNKQDGAVSIVDGRQYIDITARDGYFPNRITAKAGLPTTLRVSTNGTYDCSATLAIPALGFRKYLKPTAVEEIDIPAAKAVGTVRGLCGMGMYRFDMVFEP